ncbi:MAG: cupin domain-containing protein [Candidatus Baltobacteraceae bacterium]
MRIYISLLLFFVTGLTAGAIASRPDLNKPLIVLGGHEHWRAVGDWTKGDMVVVLRGHPKESGEYIIREKLPPHTASAVMYHPMGENNTVLSGTWYIGFGDKVDPANATELPAGSYVYIPPGVHHYSITKSQGVELEESADGPYGRTVVPAP